MNATTKPQDIYIMKKIKLIELLNAFSKITFIMAVTLFLSAFLSGCTQSVSVNYYNPNWLPDGRIIAVKESVGSVQELVNPAKVTFVNAFLVAMDIDGKNETPLFEFSALTLPVPSPDGLKIADSTNIYNMKGEIIERVPTINNRVLRIVDWSPDSRKVVLRGGEVNESPKYIYTYDLTTKELKYLTEGYEPAWNNEVGIVFRKKGFKIISDTDNQITTKNFNLVDARILPDNKTVFGLIGNNYEFYDLQSANLLRAIPKDNDHKYNFRLSPNQKYILSTDSNGVDVYLTEVETGLGRFVVKGSTYKK